MKAISWIFTAILTINLASTYAQENGAGGIKKNGVYKSLYSAGVKISADPETDIPGAELYTKTISSLVSGDIATNLLGAALPLGARTFYKIVDDEANKNAVKQILGEYIKITGEDINNLAVFALTERDTKTTYLLPSFYKLKKSEQAAVLFHEANIIMLEATTPVKLVYAEMAFQEYIEKDQAGSWSNKLPKVLEELTGLTDIAFFHALQADARLKTTPELIDVDTNIFISRFFGESCALSILPGHKWLFGTLLPPMSVDISYASLACQYNRSSVSDIVTLMSRYPKSYFLKELVDYVLNGGVLTYQETFDFSNKLRKNHQNDPILRKTANEWLKGLKSVVSYHELIQHFNEENYY